MAPTALRITLLSALYATLFVASVSAQTPTPAPAKSLLEMKAGGEKRLTPTSEQVTVAGSADAGAPGLVVRIQPGKEGYPGVSLKPPGTAWDLSPFGHVAAKIVNLGEKPLSLSLRVDNGGDWRDNPWNTETINLPPGGSGTLTTIFGYSYGRKPGYALKPKAVVNLLMFAGKSDAPQAFRLESLVASGPSGEKPEILPDAVRIKPEKGSLLGAGNQITARGAQATLVGGAVQIVLSSSEGEPLVSVKPAQGRWDLRDSLEVQVRVGNEGKTPVTPRVRLETNGGSSEWVTAGAPLAPGAETVLTVPFDGGAVHNLGQPGTGSKITSDAVSAVTVSADRAAGERILKIAAITAALPAPKIPDWLGKRPPVPGDWVKTLDDEFNGTSLDTSVWSVSGENYWDKTSHWSKNNVTVGGGVVKLRYEKKTGYNNDDPKQKPSNYASGYLHTFDRWVQRYGYFEARVKLPTAPGLWPAFWMMPDRGDRAESQGKRQDTGNGGMEFDILEFLTRWGPYRYNIAMHYDGYGKDHKSLGTDKIYVRPDAEGFITCGLLWTPGSAIYYANGREVLRWENPRISTVPEILMFTLPMGGWDNSPLEDAHLPAEFIIDYVRVWQRKDLASPVDGKKSTAVPPSRP